MSHSESADVTVTEQCSDCGVETSHKVAINLLVESERDRNTKFSREPYRVSECIECGKTVEKRMNDV